jgi:DNA polymerase sigma
MMTIILTVKAGFVTVNSDLDLIFCEDREPREDPFEIPTKLNEALNKAGYNVLMLPKTRVPIIKVNNPGEQREESSDPKKNIAVDIGFGHKSDLAFRNTHLLQTYSKCDSRLKPIVLFVKVRVDYISYSSFFC